MSKHKKQKPLTTVQKFDNPIDLYKAFGLSDKEAREIVAVQEVAKILTEMKKEGMNDNSNTNS